MILDDDWAESVATFSIHPEQARIRDIARMAADLMEAIQGVEDAERNTIDEIVCRAHPDRADAIDKFWTWYKDHKGSWIGPHRAAGAWLWQEMCKHKRKANSYGK